VEFVLQSIPDTKEVEEIKLAQCSLPIAEFVINDIIDKAFNQYNINTFNRIYKPFGVIHL
jgi:hypothetical protein